jgi:thioesterase domain-containing protein
MPDPADAAQMCSLRSGATPALDLVPSVGTTPMSLLRLARALAPARAVRAYAYRGVDDDLAPHATIAAIAAANLAELRAAAPRGPYLLGGHCLGGTVAHAMAAALEADGERVAALVVIDAVGPWPLDAGPTPARDPRVGALVDALTARTRELGPQLDPATARRVDATVRVHLAASRDYRAPPLRAPIHVLRTAETDDAVLANWDRHARVVVRHAIPGDALSTLRPPHVEATGRTLGALLARAIAG